MATETCKESQSSYCWYSLHNNVREITTAFSCKHWRYIPGQVKRGYSVAWALGRLLWAGGSPCLPGQIASILAKLSCCKKLLGSETTNTKFDPSFMHLALLYFDWSHTRDRLKENKP